MKRKKCYSCSNVKMLIVAKIIAENFKSDIDMMSTIRYDWNAVYADNLIVRIDDAMNKLLGFDKNKDLREATSFVKSTYKRASVFLSSLKQQIIKDFKSEPDLRDEILRNLGLLKSLKFYSKNQDLLIKNLQIIKSNLNEKQVELLTTKGVRKELIDSVIDLAVSFTEANNKQEILKEESKEKNKGIFDVFNAIYDDVIAICKIARIHYHGNSDKKELYSFRKLLKNHCSISKTKNNTADFSENEESVNDIEAVENQNEVI